jgi:hypothetical protein
MRRLPPVAVPGELDLESLSMTGFGNHRVTAPRMFGG